MKNNQKVTSPKDIPAWAAAKKVEITIAVCKVFFGRLKTIVGDGHVYSHGPLLLHAVIFQSLIYDWKLPSLLQLIGSAKQLGMHVELVLLHPGYVGHGDSVKFAMDRRFIRAALIRFMEDHSVKPQTGYEQTALRQYQQDYLQKIRKEGFDIHWTSVIGFFAASGFELQVWLRDAIPASQVKLPRGLKG
jgi:hypothetical protein